MSVPVCVCVCVCRVCAGAEKANSFNQKSCQFPKDTAGHACTPSAVTDKRQTHNTQNRAAGELP